MEQTLHPFLTIDSVYGPFIINRHHALQAEALLKTGHPHIRAELDALLHIADQLPPGCIAVDAGACAGLVSVPLAQRLAAQHGQVHAFEPQRSLYRALCGTAVLNQLDNLHIHPAGLASYRAGVSPSGGDAGQATLSGTSGSGQQPTPRDTSPRVVRLDSLGLARLDLLRLDIESMEIDALRGAQRLIRTWLPWCWIACRQGGEQAIMAEFADLDFAFYLIDASTLLCVPRARWDPQRLSISGAALTPVPAGASPVTDEPGGVPANDPRADWNQALAHEQRCEWGRAIQYWQLARHRGLDETAITLALASCLDFAGHTHAGVQTIDSLDTQTLENCAQAHLVRSSLLLRAGHHAPAAAARARCEAIATLPLFGLPPDRQYLGQQLEERHLLIVSYGGAGDQIQYARYLHCLRSLKCASITAIVPGALVSLFHHNFPWVTFLAAQGEWHDTSALVYDYWCSFLMLAVNFDFDPCPPELPAPAYLACPAASAQQWRDWTQERTPQERQWNIGLNWQGTASSDERFCRPASQPEFVPLARLPAAQAFCLNRDLAPPPDLNRTDILFPAGHIHDFSDLAGLMCSMDWIVTTCTAQVHLGGALGLHTILLLGPKADPRWEQGDKASLYESVHIIRATRAGQWDDAVDRAIGLIGASQLART